MKTTISISEARKQLPGIIKKLRESPDTVYQVTVRDEVVAEIKTSPQGQARRSRKEASCIEEADCGKGQGRKNIRSRKISRTTCTLPRTSRELSSKRRLL